jgi:hypothetical protein
MKTTRRTFIAGLAAASVPAGTVVAVNATQAAAAYQSAQENPELIASYDRFLAARDEVTAAKDALEWLVDEWRHRWPMAPEEILGFANADNYTAGAERDIAGRILKRDTSDFRSACFTVNEPDWFQYIVDKWEKPRTGRTEKALVRNRAHQAKVLAEYRHKLKLSEEYFTETARLRAASGVDKIKQRVKAAEAVLTKACTDVSHEPAYTTEGLRLKAEALHAQDDGLAIYMRDKGGALGGMARFIEATLSVVGMTPAKS